jgi:hypothetical protein
MDNISNILRTFNNLGPVMHDSEIGIIGTAIFWDFQISV